jgi:hypothetical protein
MDPTESESPARQLMKVLVNAGFSVDEPVQDDWVQSEALRTLGLEGEALDAALRLAGEQGWIEPWTRTRHPRADTCWSGDGEPNGMTSPDQSFCERETSGAVGSGDGPAHQA